MKQIVITIEVEGENSSIWRRYDLEGTADSLEWGDRIVDMLDTLEKSNEKKF